MKKLWIAATMACLLSMGSEARAQISVGAKGGLNLSRFSGLEGIETKSRVGFHVGGFVTFNLGRNFALQPELVYSTQGAELESFGEDLKLNYFNIPVMVKILTNSGFYGEVGPQLGFQVGSVDNNDIEGSVKSSDFSVCAGIGFQPTKSPFGVGVRYNVGVGKAGDIDQGAFENADYKNGVLQVSLYWRLFGGGKLKR